MYSMLTLFSAQLEHVEIPWFAFNDGQEPSPFEFPSLDWVRDILVQASECDDFGEGESAWNVKVYILLLRWVLREGPATRGPLDFSYW